jgi:hypothetical protein
MTFSGLMVYDVNRRWFQPEGQGRAPEHHEQLGIGLLRQRGLLELVGECDERSEAQHHHGRLRLQRLEPPHQGERAWDLATDAKDLSIE